MISGGLSKKHLFLRIIGALIILISALFVYGFFIEPKMLQVRHFTVQSTMRNAQDITIVVLSDTHVGGPHVNAARVQRIMDKVRELSPDMILLTGDYVSGHEPMANHSKTSKQEIAAGLAALGSVETPIGTFAVLGNHDWWYDGAEVRRLLEEAGVMVMDNRVELIWKTKFPVMLIGIGDVTTGHAAAKQILDEAARWNHAPQPILFTHNPDVFVGIDAGAVVNIAGHTHGGQVWLPFVGRMIVPSKYGQRFARGRYQDDPGTVLVTSGIGTSILPVRFFTPPEIMVVNLVTKN